MVDNELVKVGWIGTGVMGSPMCGHLLEAGYPVKVFSRTEERARSLVERGATWCASPADATEGSDVVVSMSATRATSAKSSSATKGCFPRLGTAPRSSI